MIWLLRELFMIVSLLFTCNLIDFPECEPYKCCVMDLERDYEFVYGEEDSNEICL